MQFGEAHPVLRPEQESGSHVSSRAQGASSPADFSFVFSEAMTILPNPASLAQHGFSPSWYFAFLNESSPTHAFLLFNTVGSGVPSEKRVLSVSEDEELPTCASVSLQLLKWDEDTGRFLELSLISGLTRWFLHFSRSARVLVLRGTAGLPAQQCVLWERHRFHCLVPIHLSLGKVLAVNIWKTSVLSG